MSYRHSNSSQVSDDFHGLKDAISEADYSMDGGDERRDKKKETKKFLFKKDSKDKGYSTLSVDNSQDSVFLVNTKNYKKPKTDNKKATLNVFKKSKEDKYLKGIKESKEEMKRSKKVKEHHSGESGASAYKHESMFGTSFENAARYYASSDAVKVPYPIRVCIDIIEQKGIDNENLYRHHHAHKSQIDSICESINTDKFESRLDELNADPSLACGIIKKFLKETKTPLVTDDVIVLIDKFDPNVADKQQKVEHLRRCLAKLPASNYETFAYLIMHFHRVLACAQTNKVDIGLFVQKFQPLFRIKERTFKFVILNADLIFSDFRFKKCRVKTTDESNSRLSQLPDSIEGLEQEIAKQEVHLAKLHNLIANQEQSVDKSEQEKLCEELWTLQRYVTSLKRKVKKLKNERKLMELEQTKAENENKAGDENRDPLVNLSNLYSKEMNIICENFVLIESVQQYLSQINKEKAMICELHQKLLSNYATTTALMGGTDATDVVASLAELKENEQLLINENKLLEERINLINKRIKNEKDKIFELKLNIKLKTLENVQPPNFALDSSNNSVIAKSAAAIPSSKTALELVAGHVNPTTEKESVMTKL